MREKLGRPTTQTNERAHMFAVAGILHDVGKISKPAGIQLTQQERNLENQSCPTWDGRYTHDHVLHTAWILNQSQPPLGGLNSDEVFRIAVNHHRPSTNDIDEIIIAKADRLASAHDRRDKPSGESDWPTGLDNLLSTVRGGKPETSKIQIPTGLLSFDDGKYLPSKPQTRQEYESACKAITDALIDSLSNPTNENNDAFTTCERLLAIAQRTMHTIPASRWKETKPDVTLLDHSRIVAAFGACLGTQFDGSSEVKNGAYRLVTFKISGIQNFIFRDIQAPDSPTNHKGMAKRLRATSTLVALLTTLAGRRVLQWTGMPITNMVLDAGGNGMLLLPATTAIDKLLFEAIDWLQDWMNLNLLGGCRLLIEAGPILRDEAFMAGKCAETFRNAHDSVNKQAMQPPTSSLLCEDAWCEEMFVVSGEGGFEIDRPSYKDSLLKFGEVLPKSTYIQLDNPEAKTSINIFGYEVGLHKNRPTAGHYWSLALDEKLDIPAQLITSHVPKKSDGDVV
ncbi:MAG: HD domain-containing protein, partial [Phycisphaerales bacterium]|nr:HD domain-containing protein [Phycisphaerales bacterium]